MDAQALQFSSSIFMTPLAMKFACTVLFGLLNTTLPSPSNSPNSTGGGGSRGTIRTTLLSTFGGGRKLFLLTFMTRSTFAYSCTFADSRDQKALPGCATNRAANSRWNISIATRKRGRWERSRNTSGEEIWYGVLEMQTSKYG